MFSKIRPWKRDEPNRANNLASACNSGLQVPVGASVTSERELLIETQQPNETSSGSNVVTNGNSIEITDQFQEQIYTVAFVADGEYVVGGGLGKKIRRWRVVDGEEVGKPMDVGGTVWNLASPDGKSVVSATGNGRVVVWNAENHEKVNEFKAHDKDIRAVDISIDGTRIATGADDNSLRVWSFPAGQRLLGPLEHNNSVVAVKFSPNGKFIATATGYKESIRIYDSSNGRIIVKFRVQVNSLHNESLAWASDANRLFALSRDGDIHHLDMFTNKTHVSWCIHNDDRPRCIALACNDTVIAASANSSISFWDTMTHQQIGTIIHHPHPIRSIAISQSYDIATAGDSGITLRNLCDILPSPYRNNLQQMLCQKREIRRLRAEKNDLEDMVRSLRMQDAYQNRKITHLDRELRCILAASQHAVNQSAKTIRSLHTGLHPHEVRWVPQIAVLEKTTQELHGQLAASHHALRLHDKIYECETMYAHGRIYVAAQSLLEIASEMTEDLGQNKLIVDWLQEFTDRCISEFRTIGIEALGAGEHDAALSAYSAILPFTSLLPNDVLTALSLRSSDVSDIIVKCCKARVGLLGGELVHVTKVTERDPLNYEGYKMKHAVLHSLGRYKEAFEAYRTMLSRMENSVDPQVRDTRNRYLDVTPLVRKVVEQTINDIPHVLVDATTGRIYDKSTQAVAFEECSMFNQLRFSMIIRDRFDRARIQLEVEFFYKYVMFSHRWQPPEPSFQMVKKTPVYGLPPSLGNDKLINFCKLVQSRGFRWAWSDTCCVDQSDKGIQQESVVAMFQWYCRAALTIVHLLGVHSKSQRKGSLWKSIWNTRGWTYQEYVASKVVQFYTEDWKPYLDLDMFNHKESLLVLSEMEQATRFSTRALATLQPGLTRAREKLHLASRRETTRVEDIAYSLFGIFNVALPVIYGEGNQAVGRLLEHILARSLNVTILAWTGISGSNHSYLPSNLTVYDQVIPPHIPQPVETTKMDRIVMDVQSSFPDLSPIVMSYRRLHDLPSLSIFSGRLKLTGLVFPLNNLAPLSQDGADPNHPGYRATSRIVGDVRIETRDNLIGMDGLVLVHPWISPLIDEDFSGSTSRFDVPIRALRLVVRLKQPFGALLLASEGRVQYKRVATDSFIKVQIQAETPLEELMDSIRTVDIQ